MQKPQYSGQTTMAADGLAPCIIMSFTAIPDSRDHGANMGPMNLAISDGTGYVKV